MKNSNVLSIDDIQPSVNGFTFIASGNKLEIEYSDLFQFAQIHFPEKAQTVGQFNMEIENSDETELYDMIDTLFTRQPGLCHLAKQFPMNKQEGHPAPEQDPYDGFKEGQTLLLNEIQPMARKQLHTINSATEQIHSMKVTQANMQQQIQKLIKLVDDVVNASVILQNGQPTIPNLLEGHKVIRRTATGKWNGCSHQWLERYLSTEDITALMACKVITVRSKIGRGYTNFEVKRVQK